jgi:hypothetical protein
MAMTVSHCQKRVWSFAGLGKMEERARSGAGGEKENKKCGLH